MSDMQVCICNLFGFVVQNDVQRLVLCTKFQAPLGLNEFKSMAVKECVSVCVLEVYFG